MLASTLRFNSADRNFLSSFLGIRLSWQPITHLVQGVYYEVNLQTQACTKGKLQGPFIPHGVGLPVLSDGLLGSRHAVPNSTFLGNFVIGSSSYPGGGVLTEAWTTNITSNSTINA